MLQANQQKKEVLQRSHQVLTNSEAAKNMARRQCLPLSLLVLCHLQPLITLQLDVLAISISLSGKLFTLFSLLLAESVLLPLHLPLKKGWLTCVWLLRLKKELLNSISAATVTQRIYQSCSGKIVVCVERTVMLFLQDVNIYLGHFLGGYNESGPGHVLPGCPVAALSPAIFPSAFLEF